MLLVTQEGIAHLYCLQVNRPREDAGSGGELRYEHVKLVEEAELQVQLAAIDAESAYTGTS